MIWAIVGYLWLALAVLFLLSAVYFIAEEKVHERRIRRAWKVRR